MNRLRQMLCFVIGMPLFVIGSAVLVVAQWDLGMYAALVGVAVLVLPTLVMVDGMRNMRAEPSTPYRSDGELTAHLRPEDWDELRELGADLSWRDTGRSGVRLAHGEAVLRPGSLRVDRCPGCGVARLADHQCRHAVGNAQRELARVDRDWADQRAKRAREITSTVDAGEKINQAMEHAHRCWGRGAPDPSAPIGAMHRYDGPTRRPMVDPIDPHELRDKMERQTGEIDRMLRWALGMDPQK